ncbi:MAG: acetylornithine/succinylornithine family transaminase [Oscillospiraceae bacterium]|nr:acetylornithine/succinylornithine family transaminase [Oscillospiraceae bacterium]
MDIKEVYDKFVMDTYGRTGLCVESGSGSVAVGDDGVDYIDFGSGIATNSLGFCDSDWVYAVCEQTKALQHTSNYYYNVPCGLFAAKLCEITGYDKVFFGNSGAEANECALKLARKYSFDKYGRKDRGTVITLTNSFHGRTLSTLAATGQDTFHNYFYPFPPGFEYVKTNDIDELKSKINADTCAIMFEYIQGEGGVIPLTSEFVDAIFELAREHDLVTIADEVQTGVGRTGEFSAGTHYGKKADISTFAKGLGGGLPIGVCAAASGFSTVLTKGTHGSTFGGNPVVCAGGMSVLKKVSEPEFLRRVREKGQRITAALKEFGKVKSISGKGLMFGLELTGITAVEAMNQCAKQGLLVLTAKDKLRLLPPLNISDENIDKAIIILKNILN